MALLPGGRIPQACCLVIASGEHKSTIVRKDRGLNEASVSPEIQNLRTVGYAPQPGCTILASGESRFAIWGERDRTDHVAMPDEGLDLLSRSHIPKQRDV